MVNRRAAGTRSVESLHFARVLAGRLTAAYRSFTKSSTEEMKEKLLPRVCGCPPVLYQFCPQD